MNLNVVAFPSHLFCRSRYGITKQSRPLHWQSLPQDASACPIALDCSNPTWSLRWTFLLPICLSFWFMSYFTGLCWLGPGGNSQIWTELYGKGGWYMLLTCWRCCVVEMSCFSSSSPPLLLVTPPYDVLLGSECCVCPGVEQRTIRPASPDRVLYNEATHTRRPHAGLLDRDP